jgi:hypothetical protein
MTHPGPKIQMRLQDVCGKCATRVRMSDPDLTLNGASGLIEA